jgi:hypothetical protein
VFEACYALRLKGRIESSFVEWRCPSFVKPLLIERALLHLN